MNMEWSRFISTSDPLFQLSAFFMVFNPIFWNLTAQGEYRLNLISGCVAGHKKFACIVLGIVIFALGIYRDVLFHEMMGKQPVYPADETLCMYVGWGLIAVGQVLNLAVFYRLGLFGVYLGDYFGIFVLDAPVTAFPYNITADPQYWGSAMTFLGDAICSRSPAGLVQTLILSVTYKCASLFESKMLHELYAEKARREKKGK